MTKCLLKYRPTQFQWAPEQISKSCSDRRNKVKEAEKNKARRNAIQTKMNDCAQKLIKKQQLIEMKLMQQKTGEALGYI